MKKIYASLDIGHYSLKLLVCEIKKDNTIKVLFRDAIKTDNVVKNQNELGLELVWKIKTLLSKATKETKLLLDNLYVTYFAKNARTVAFDEKFHISSGHTYLTKNDIQSLEKRLKEKLSFSQLMLNDLFVEKYVVNNTELYSQAPIGVEARNIRILGNAFYCESKTHNFYENVLRSCNVKVLKMLPSHITHSFASAHEIEISEPLLTIDIGHRQISFNYFKNNSLIKSLSLPFGSSMLDEAINAITGSSHLWSNAWKNNYNAIHSFKQICFDEFTAYEKVNPETGRITKVCASLLQQAIRNSLEKLFENIYEIIEENQFSTNRILWTGGGSSLRNFERLVKEYFYPVKNTVYQPKEIGLGYNGIYANCIGIIRYQEILNNRLVNKQKNSLKLFSNIFYTNKIATAFVFNNK